MNKLTISLTGNITESNFDEWKMALLDQIDRIQKELKSDGDFALATDQAKELKKAELALKQAKESAINQASEIQRLFEAIDEVSAAARNARLYLEGQVKARKQEMKDEIVLSGVRKVRAQIEQQDDDFQELALHSREYTDKGMFEEAIKGKRGIEGMEAAVQVLVDRLSQEISERAKAVAGRARKIAEIAPEYRPLFQDRSALLDQSDDELDATITKRIEVFSQQQAELAAAAVPILDQKDPEPQSQADEGDLFAEKTGETDQAKSLILRYRIILDVVAQKKQADDLVEELQKSYGNRPTVESISIEPLRKE